MELHADVTLHAGVPRVDLRIHGDNRARDHRLRIRFPLGKAAPASKSESAFSVVERPVAVDELERGSAEPAVPEFPQQAFTSVDAGSRGLTIANRGLPEASVLDDGEGTIAVTLLRCVGFLSRGDLLTRIEGAGPFMPTPDAQLQGPFTAELSIIPHAGMWADAAAHRAAHAVNARLAAVELPGGRPLTDPWRREPAIDGEPLPAAASLLEVDGALEVTAVKRAEDRGELVVRLLNQSNAPARARLRPMRAPATARRLSIGEEPLEALDVVDGWVDLELGAWEIGTVGIGFEA
jgi:alpha-mannosidase